MPIRDDYAKHFGAYAYKSRERAPASDIVIDATTTASVASIISPTQWVARNTAMHLDG